MLVRMHAYNFDEARAEASEFSSNARALFAKAESLSAECPDSDLEQWMELAKKRGMTWVEGLEWITQIRAADSHRYCETVRAREEKQRTRNLLHASRERERERGRWNRLGRVTSPASCCTLLTFRRGCRRLFRRAPVEVC